MGISGVYEGDPFASRASNPTLAGVPALLIDWRRRATESQAAHYEAAKYLARMHYLLGMPVIIFTTVVGTAIFATFEDGGSAPTRIALGLFSVAAAVLAALQTFLRFTERAEKHRSSGAGFGALRREIEHYLSQYNVEAEAPDLTALRTRYDELAQSSPEIPHQIWERLHGR